MTHVDVLLAHIERTLAECDALGFARLRREAEELLRAADAPKNRGPQQIIKKPVET